MQVILHFVKLPKANSFIYEQFCAVLHEGAISQHVQYMIKVLMEVIILWLQLDPTTWMNCMLLLARTVEHRRWVLCQAKRIHQFPCCPSMDS